MASHTRIENPSNLGTRGISFEELSNSDWIEGPDWLKKPVVLVEDKIHTATKEIDEHLCFVNEKLKETVVHWQRFSQFRLLRPTVANIFRWKTNKDANLKELLSKAKSTIWKSVQSELFPNEKKVLLSGQEISYNTEIATLAPFIDTEGVLRAKGRLRRAKMDFESKHPIVLSCHHRVVELYLNHEHQLYNHEGVEYLRTMIQRRF